VANALTRWLPRADNTAFDSEIRELSGANEAEAAYGNWFNYWETARAQIFRREQSNVVDMASMQRLMRLNRFKQDPLSTQIETCQ
jgi:hypothetical protein